MSSIARIPRIPTRHRVPRHALLAVAVSWVFLSLSATSALAKNVYVFGASFGSAGSGAGEFKEPSGVAVDSATNLTDPTAGDVYVLDKGNDRVEYFNSSGSKLEGEFTGAETLAKSFSEPEGIAVDNSGDPLDPSAGDVYVLDTGHDVIDKFSATGQFEGELKETEGAEGGIAGVAVDAAGNVWLYANNGWAIEYNDTGKYVAGSAFNTEKENGHGLAVDASDHLYIITGARFARRVTATEPGEVGPAINESGTVNGVTVDDASGDVYVDQGSAIEQYGPLGEPLTEPIEEFGKAQLTDESGAGIAVNEASKSTYVVDSAADVVDVFDQVPVPDVTTTSATNHTATTAVLNGTVNPEGVAVSSCEFAYASDASFAAHESLANEVQTLTLSAATGGDFTLTFQSQTTAPIPYNASAAEVKSALGALSSVGGEGNIEVSGEEGGPYAIEFKGSLAHTPVPELTADASGLTPPGATATVAVAVAIAPCEHPDAAEIGSGTSPVAVHANLAGLQQGGEYHFRLVAANANGTVDGNDRAFATATPPTIEAAADANLASSSVDLTATINPHNGDTHYRFEYGTSTAYGTSIPIPEADTGEEGSPVSVSQHVTGLSSNVTYHWRLVVENPAGSETSLDHTFIYDTTGPGLPDGRAYEMVSPPFKNGSLLGAAQTFALPSTISEDGTRLIRTVVQCFGGAVSCPALTPQVIGTPYQFERTTAGWVTTPLAPPATQFEENAGWGVNANTGIALFRVPAAEGVKDLYLRRPGPTPSDTPSFTDIGPLTEPGKPPITGVEHQATADGSHVVFSLKDEDKWSFDETTGEGAGNSNSLYEYSGTGNSQPVLVGVTGPPGSDALISRCATYYGEQHQVSAADAYAVSETGETIFFTAFPCAGGSGVNENVKVPDDTLYARIAGSETVKISAPFAPDCEPSCQSSKPATATFQGASLNGSRAFFTSAQRLTDQATEGEEEIPGGGPGDENLYEAEIAKSGAGSSEVKSLIALSGGDTSGNGPRVQGVMAISPGGSHVYFVAQGVLTSEERSGCKAEFEGAGEPEEGGCHPTEGANNLYVFAREPGQATGHLAFVATLSSDTENMALKLQQDALQWREAGGGTANVTPEGRYLVFMSDARLTADDTDVRQARQVFRYDAATGALVRISVGQRGFNDNGNAAAADAEIVNSAGGLIGHPRSDPTMSNDGSYVFFQSPVGLTSQALDEVPVEGSATAEHLYAQNVYEYHEGHVYLVSDGRDTAAEGTTCRREDELSLRSAVCLIGTDETGRNVFFTTADPLVPADTDTQLDIYDARICGAEGCIQSAAAPPPPCLGEACHGTPAAIPPIPGVPSLTFNGTGNFGPSPAVTTKPLTRAQKLAAAVKACKKDKSKAKRRTCEASARKKYGPLKQKKAKKTSHKGRA